MRLLTLLLLFAVSLCARDMKIIFIDVEGGQATLIVSPSGESMLIDAGWPGNDGRDAKRIKEAMKRADIKRIDYMVMSHYHLDHVGGVGELASRVEIVNFVDKGENTEKDPAAQRLTRTWQEAYAKGKRITVKPGDKIPIKGLDVLVVSADGAVIGDVPGATPNATCPDVNVKIGEDENPRSLGVLVSTKNFRFLDLSDLTQDREKQLVCPLNKLGRIDLFLSSHHGYFTSNYPGLVQAINPKVIVMNNGARKGGAKSSVDTFWSLPAKPDLWQLHFAVANAKEGNTTDPFIANVYENDNADYITADIDGKGKIKITNSRNKFSKTY